MTIQTMANNLAPTTAPQWARELAAGPIRQSRIEEAEVSVQQGRLASLLTVRLKGAARWVAADFQERVTRLYALIQSQLTGLPHRFPARFWNYLPCIHEPMDSGRDRYMVFNAGRFHALDAWFGGAGELPHRLPAASCVGHHAADFVVNCLSMQQPGVLVDNPRQVPAYRYSSRYGPLPPCFARGTLIDDPATQRRLLIAAGTASIRGEESVFPGDLQAQFQETLKNLNSLLTVAEQTIRVPGGSFIDLRIYHPVQRHRKEIQRLARSAFGPSAHLEIIPAHLCRNDLLVEIEGLARLGGPVSP